MKTKYTKKINGLVETFTLQRTRKARNCHICKTSISKGDEYANILFWVNRTDLASGQLVYNRTLPMPVCIVCANDDTPYYHDGN